NRPNKNNDPQDLLDHDDEEDVYIAQIVEEPITKGELSLYREAVRTFKFLVESLKEKPIKKPIKMIIRNLNKSILACSSHRFPSFIGGNISRILNDPVFDISDENRELLENTAQYIELQQYQGYRRIIKALNDINETANKDVNVVSAKIEYIIRVLPQIKQTQHLKYIKQAVLNLLNNPDYVSKYHIKIRLLFVLENILRLEFADKLSNEKRDFIGRSKKRSISHRNRAYLDDIYRGAKVMNMFSDMWEKNSNAKQPIPFDVFIDDLLDLIMYDQPELSSEQRIRFFVALYHLKAEYLVIEKHMNIANSNNSKLLETITGVSMETGIKKVIYNTKKPFMVYFDFESDEKYFEFVKKLHENDNPESRQGEYRRFFVSAFGYTAHGSSPYIHELNHAFFNAVSRSLKQEIDYDWIRASFQELFEQFAANVKLCEQKRCEQIIDAVIEKMLYDLTDEFLAFYMDRDSLSKEGHINYYIYSMGACIAGKNAIIHDLEDHIAQEKISDPENPIIDDIKEYLADRLRFLKRKIKVSEIRADAFSRLEPEATALSFLYMLTLNKYDRLKYFYSIKDVAYQIEEYKKMQENIDSVRRQMYEIEEELDLLPGKKVRASKGQVVFSLQDIGSLFSEDKEYQLLEQKRQKQTEYQAKLMELFGQSDVIYRNIVDMLSVMFFDEDMDIESDFEENIPHENSPLLKKFIMLFLQRAEDQGNIDQAEELLKYFFTVIYDLEGSVLDNIFRSIELEKNEEEQKTVVNQLSDHTQKYLEELKNGTKTIKEQEKTNNAIILYADDIIADVFLFDIEDTFRLLTSDNGILNGGTVILYTITSDVMKRQKVDALKLMIEQSCSDNTKVEILEKHDVWGEHDLKTSEEDVSSELEQIFNALRSKQNVNNKLGGFIKQENILGVILGSRKGLIELCSDYYMHEVPVVMIDGIRNGVYGIFSFAQAVSFAIQIKQNNGDAGWGKVLYPIEVAEDLRDSYMRYRNEVLIKA
ncbi:MAG: hypothetical protein PHQ52_07900, partial [Candidatus Omnitrophica bacterium]|nr:hypothetical protein [Candidatus Omnitrophota bacterium]